mmetsp:Transcript_71728/g.191370  ORF Transcript_71728/g.191370 Transcript_71728/m.191370 type:complete len:663 (-) Transcript_71728:5-1993(-)
MNEVNQDDDLECRICRGGLEVGSLLHPCKCAGSIKYVHEDCIKLWLQRTRAKSCELCHHSFKFSPVYAPDTPPRLPTTIFLYGFLRIFGKHLLLLLRLALVIFLWVICLPIGTSWMCRLFFLRSFQGLLKLHDRLNGGALIVDWMQGLLLSFLVVGVFLAVSALRDYLIRMEGNFFDVLGDPQPFQDVAEPMGAAAAADAAAAAAAGVVEMVERNADQNGGPQAEDIQDVENQPIRANIDVDHQPTAEEAAASEPATDAAAQDLPPSARQEAPPEVLTAAEPREAPDPVQVATNDGAGAAPDGHTAVAAPEAPLAGGGVEDAVGARVDEGNQGGDRGVQDDGGDGGMGGLGAGRDDEVPLEEFLGLRGPIRHMVENAVTALVSNALFIGLLTLLPFSVGRLAILIKTQVGAVLRVGGGSGGHYSDGVTLLVGYVCIMLLVLELVLLSLLLGPRMHRSFLSPDAPLMRQLLSLVRYAFLLCKVGLLLGIELVVFPLCCGWLLDFCALPVLSTTWPQRLHFAAVNPFAAQLLHWVVGVLFMLHLSVLVAVLREVLRPEVLWFLRNPADPDEHPFRDLVEEPLSKHARRLFLSLALYAPLTMLLVHAPALILRALFPALLPLRLQLDNPFVDARVGVVLVHLSLPLLMDRLRPRDSFKVVLDEWA